MNQAVTHRWRCCDIVARSVGGETSEVLETSEVWLVRIGAVILGWV
jgi:hypothetical protein